MTTLQVEADTFFSHVEDASIPPAELPLETVGENFGLNEQLQGSDAPVDEDKKALSASPETDDLISRYFGEIRQYDLLKIEEERALWRRIDYYKGRMRRVLYLSPVALPTLLRLWNQVRHGERSPQQLIRTEVEADVDTGVLLEKLSSIVTRLHDLDRERNALLGSASKTDKRAAQRGWRRHERIRLMRLTVEAWDAVAFQPLVDETLRMDLERAVTDDPDNRVLRTANRAWHAAKQKRDAATDQMLRANLRLVIHVARRFRDSRVPLLDLIQEGNLGLMRAIEKFDPQRDVKFVTYGHWWIRQAIGRAVINQGRTVRLPEHVVNRQQKMRVMKDNLQQQSGRMPTSEEIGAALGWKPKEVAQLELDLQGAISLEQSASSGSRTVADFIAEPDRDAFAVMAESEGLRQCLESCFSQLTSREAFILKRRYGFDDEKPQSLRIVGEALGLSRERVRQIEKATLQRIRESSMKEQLADFRGN